VRINSDMRIESAKRTAWAENQMENTFVVDSALSGIENNWKGAPDSLPKQAGRIIMMLFSI